jgi:hypothetical protein
MGQCARISNKILFNFENNVFDWLTHTITALNELICLINEYNDNLQNLNIKVIPNGSAEF